ncbi:MAG: DUF2851 family protein [Chlamydiota bacterium]
MLSDYETLIDDAPLKVSEKEERYQFITERHVQVMWLNQKYFTPLTTTDGESIIVISPGIWNAGGGPDFKKAHVKIGEKEIRGDVEIHLRDEGWVQHQHHLDPLYNQVILHISFWQSSQKKIIINEQGNQITQSYFESALTIPEKRITQLIDLDLYPYKKFCGNGRCANELFKKTPEKSIRQFFQDASLWRLEKKRRHLYSRVDDSRLYMQGGVAMALGYKENAEAFLDLYHYLIPHRRSSKDLLLAMAMRCCGLFSPHFHQKWKNSTYFKELKAIDISSELFPENSILLRLHKIRPINHPIRRLAYLIKMIKDPSFPQLHQRMEAHWHATWPLLTKEKDFKEHLEELCEMIPTYEDEYWNHHYTFEEKAKKNNLPLIGKSLKMEILINTYFPLLYASIQTRGVDKELESFTKLYSSVKGQATRKSKYLQHRFFGESEKSSILKEAISIQGAYQLHHDFCIHYEASCEGCPFIQRYQEVYDERCKMI